MCASVQVCVCVSSFVSLRGQCRGRRLKGTLSFQYIASKWKTHAHTHIVVSLKTLLLLCVELVLTIHQGGLSFALLLDYALYGLYLTQPFAQWFASPTYSGKEVSVVPASQTWGNSRAACQSLGGDLATVSSSAVRARVMCMALVLCVCGGV